MKIVTFNANSIRSRLPVILEWMEVHKPDVLCIQETKVQDAEFPEDAIRDAGYHVVFKGEKSYNGVALISPEPVSSVSFGFDDGEPKDEARLLCAEYKGVHIVNTYVPQGREIDHEMYQYKQRWFKRLKRMFDERFAQDDLVVWLGDLNVAREPKDVYKPETRKQHVCFHQDVRDVFEATLSWGFEDVLRRFHPEEGVFTFFDYRTPNAAKRGMGWRIDYVLASPAMAEKAVRAEIDLEPRLKPKPSDHTFLYAEFDV